MQASHGESIKPSGQGALQVLEKSVLAEITPKQDGAALQAANPLQPLFARMKSKRYTNKIPVIIWLLIHCKIRGL